MIYGGEMVDVVFKLGSLDSTGAANYLASVFNLFGEDVEFYRNRIPFTSALGEIRGKKRKSFNMGAESFHAHFSELVAHDIQVLTVKNKGESNLTNLVKLVNSVCGINGFTQACVMNQAYNFWQNAEDPIEYGAGGRSLGGLPMISNGLPDPLQRMVVDTSGNPGRRILRDGYIEMIGGVMWFSAPFWSLVGDESRSEIIKLGVNIDYLGSECVRLSVSERPFNFDTPQQFQEDLRCLVYGSAIKVGNKGAGAEVS